jgi:hypothetical protein
MIRSGRYQVVRPRMRGLCGRDRPVHIRTILVVGLLCGLGLSVHPAHLAADSDLWIACSEEFAVFDRLMPSGRQLHVVPWTDPEDLRIAATTQMPEGQPHAWAIYRRYVAVRTWNDLHIYHVDDRFHPQLILSQRIDDDRGYAGGPTAIEVRGSILRAYGVQWDIEIDLDSCATECVVQFEAPAETVPRQDHMPRCSVRRGDVLFALTEATTRHDTLTYIDVYLTRRRVSLEGVALIDNPLRPETTLYLGTRGPYR